jgi:hypothetical protein
LTSPLDGKESASSMHRPVNPRCTLDRKLGNAGTGLQDINVFKKVKLCMLQAVEAHRVVRRRGSHIF